MIQEDEIAKFSLAKKRKKKWTGWRPETDVQKIEFKKKVMENRDEKHEEMLGTIQKLLRLPLVKWRTARKPKEKFYTTHTWQCEVIT